jgi:hypothetical protein
MRLCDLVNSSADFSGPGAGLVSKDQTSTEEEQKNIGDKRAKEFQATIDHEQMFNQTQAQLPGNLSFEALRWFAEGSGRLPLFGKPPRKLWNGKLESV